MAILVIEFYNYFYNFMCKIFVYLNLCIPYTVNMYIMIVSGQPYAGGSGNRIGSAPLRKFNPGPTGNIRGSGALANRSVSIL